MDMYACACLCRYDTFASSYLAVGRGLRRLCHRNALSSGTRRLSFRCCRSSCQLSSSLILSFFFLRTLHLGKSGSCDCLKLLAVRLADFPILSQALIFCLIMMQIKIIYIFFLST